MNLEPISEDVIRREIEAAIADAKDGAHNKLHLTQEQTEALLRMRRAGVPWPRVLDIWHRAGWPGSHKTLSRIATGAERNGT